MLVRIAEQVLQRAFERRAAPPAEHGNAGQAHVRAPVVARAADHAFGQRVQVEFFQRELEAVAGLDRQRVEQFAQHRGHAFAVPGDAAGPLGDRRRRVHPQDHVGRQQHVRDGLAQVVRERAGKAFAQGLAGGDERAHAFAHGLVDGEMQGAPLRCGQRDVVRVEHVEQHAAEDVELGHQRLGLEVGQVGPFDAVFGGNAGDVAAVAREAGRREQRGHAFVQHGHRVDQHRPADAFGGRHLRAHLVGPYAQHGVAQLQHAVRIERECMGGGKGDRHVLVSFHATGTGTHHTGTARGRSHVRTPYA